MVLHIHNNSRCSLQAAGRGDLLPEARPNRQKYQLKHCLLNRDSGWQEPEPQAWILWEWVSGLEGDSDDSEDNIWEVQPLPELKEEPAEPVPDWVFLAILSLSLCISKQIKQQIKQLG